MYNLVEISKVVLEKIHKMLSISFRYYLSLERGVALHLNTTESSFVLSFIETGPVVLDKTIKMCLYHSINKLIFRLMGWLIIVSFPDFDFKNQNKYRTI